MTPDFRCSCAATPAAVTDLTWVTADGRRIVPDPPLVTPLRDLQAEPSDEGQDKELQILPEGYAPGRTPWTPTCSTCSARCAGPPWRAHTRSGDPIAISACLGGGDRFDRALTRFAHAYADQNERDFQALGAAVHSVRITAAEL